MGAASPALARPGILDAGPSDQPRYSRCYATTLPKISQDASAKISEFHPAGQAGMGSARAASDHGRRAARTQNSFPSGSASTTQLASP